MMAEGTPRTYFIKDLNDKVDALDEFSKCMDKQSKHLHNWERFAYALGVPPDMIRECKLYNSPTKKLFNYLQATQPQLTIGDLRAALTSNPDRKRNDLDTMLKVDYELFDQCKVSKTITNSITDILDKLALELDSTSNYNWEALGLALGINRAKMKEFEMCHNYNPTEDLFRVLYATSTKKVKLDVIVGYLEKMERNDILKEMESTTQSIDKSATDARDILIIGSELLNTISKMLNDDSLHLEGWKGLANRLLRDGYLSDRDIISKLDPPHEHDIHSPTKQVIEWLTSNKPDLTMDELITTCENIGRSGDAMEILTRHFSKADKATNIVQLPKEQHQDATKKMNNTIVNLKNVKYNTEKQAAKVEERTNNVDESHQAAVGEKHTNKGSEEQYSSGPKDDPDPDPSDDYRMESDPRGLLVIINIQKFAADPALSDYNKKQFRRPSAERKGSEKDVNELIDLFGRYLNFKVSTIIDKPSQEILKELNDIADNNDYKDYDCLAVCIMSHGTNDAFCAYDGIQIKVSKVLNMFSNSNCKIFRDKPKLFFIEACRGQKGKGAMDNVVVNSGPSGNEDTSEEHTQIITSIDPDMADMLIAYSCFEDYISNRDPEKGSCFIQILVCVFKVYAHKEHVMDMMTRVNNEVHEHMHGVQIGRTQVPAPTSTLRKRVYFLRTEDSTKSQASERNSIRDVTVTETRAAEHEGNSEISKKQYFFHRKDGPDSSDVYRMKSNPRGLMVIINMQKFDVDPTIIDKVQLEKELFKRNGSERDVGELTDLFSGKLNFKVCTIIDKTRLELLRELRKFSEDSAYKGYDCLAVCIMSHGKDDKFYAHDGKSIKVSAVYNIFSNSLCEGFRFKPKLFFIQAACRERRGSDLDMADMLIAYSDYPSYRDTEEGSYFIQSLVRFFREYADSEHVEEILTRVKNEVHRLMQLTAYPSFEDYTSYRHTEEGSYFIQSWIPFFRDAYTGLMQETSTQVRTQLPASASTLRKKLYFWPEMDFNEGS